jgi:GTP:adenosylcobinamide-phosphate guanylyltransferase
VKHHAILLAGSRPGRDEFAAQFGTDMKALIAIGGEPMVRRPVRALLGSQCVEDVSVLSQAPDRMAAVIPATPHLRFRSSQGTIAETLMRLCDDPATRWPLLVTTADHALLDPAIVDEFCRGAGSSGIAIGVVERRRLLARFPHAERTWLRFRGGAYTGANLFHLQSPAVRPAIELWRSVEQDRKKAMRVVSLLGPATLLLVALRWISLDAVLRKLGRKLGFTIKAVPLSNPLAGVDVDKPADHNLVEAILAGEA